MKLYDEGKFGLTDRVADYLPILKKTDKSRITVQDLLFHESGLPAYWPFYEEAVDMKSCKGGL
jgi:CubicO group peptidase (beta-lactamase class C family)